MRYRGGNAAFTLAPVLRSRYSREPSVPLAFMDRPRVGFAEWSDTSHSPHQPRSLREAFGPFIVWHKRRPDCLAREADLLPVPYFHVVFTLPAPIAFCEVALTRGRGKRLSRDLIEFGRSPDRLELEDEATPDMTLAEIAEHLFKAHGERFVPSVVWRFFDRRSITFKKNISRQRAESAGRGRGTRGVEGISA